MAKTKAALLSLGARGTIADTITFQKGNRVKIARTKPVPTDPRTAAQLAQRQTFQDAVSVWNALSAADKEAWRGVCPGLTAYQCFMRSELANTPTPPPTEYTEEQTQNLIGLANLRAGSFIRAAQRLPVSSRTLTKLSFRIKRNGSAAGAITFTIRKVSDDSIINSKLWGDAADLPTDFTWPEVTFDSPILINEEVRISVEFSGGSSGNEVMISGATSDEKPGEWFEWYDTSWAKPAEWDFGYIYTYTLP